MMELDLFGTTFNKQKKAAQQYFVDHQIHFIFPVRKGRRIAMNETWKDLSREKR